MSPGQYPVQDTSMDLTAAALILHWLLLDQLMPFRPDLCSPVSFFLFLSPFIMNTMLFCPFIGNFTYLEHLKNWHYFSHIEPGEKAAKHNMESGFYPGEVSPRSIPRASYHTHIPKTQWIHIPLDHMLLEGMLDVNPPKTDKEPAIRCIISGPHVNP